MRSAAQFATEVSHAHNSHAIGIFFAEQGGRARFAGGVEIHDFGGDDRPLGDAGIDVVLDGDELLARDRPGLREIEPQPVFFDLRPALRGMAPQRFLQGVM